MRFILCLLCAALFAACGSQSESLHPEWQPISASVYASGVVKSEDQYEVYPTVSGTIREVLVDDGDRVTKGQVIMRIDNRTQQWTRENAALLSNYSSVPENSAQLADAEDAVQLADEKLKNDSLLYVRTLNMSKAGAVSRVELEQRELGYKSSRHAYQTTLVRLHELKRQLNYNARQTQNSFSIMKKSENDYLVRSDLDGTVYGVMKEEGELASPQFPLAVIGSSNHFVLEMQVDEYDIARILPGMTVYVTMDTYRGSVFEAKISKINPIMNERSKTFTVEAVFTKAPSRLFPNTSFEASILLESKEKALVIPRRFLLQGDRVLLADGTMRKVTVGLRDYEYVEILEGISEADEIRLEE